MNHHKQFAVNVLGVTASMYDAMNTDWANHRTAATVKPTMLDLKATIGEQFADLFYDIDVAHTTDEK